MPDVMVDAGEHLGVAGDVCNPARRGEIAAHQDVGRLAEVDPRVALDEGAQRNGGEVGLTSLSDPFTARPMGVRMASMMTALGIAPPRGGGWP